ncbi:uncharacterized protein VTP21DRAFT_6147 [Calcarisporiella thermophila]|uniref:uncharacterized protein n=1 Tax=Calcarisporiella thermophila TaxID=911321 RepID=UPI0037428866
MLTSSSSKDELASRSDMCTSHLQSNNVSNPVVEESPIFDSPYEVTKEFASEPDEEGIEKNQVQEFILASDSDDDGEINIKICEDKIHAHPDSPRLDSTCSFRVSTDQIEDDANTNINTQVKLHQFVFSQNGKFAVALWSDGNLVLFSLSSELDSFNSARTIGSYPKFVLEESLTRIFQSVLSISNNGECISLFVVQLSNMECFDKEFIILDSKGSAVEIPDYRSYDFIYFFGDYLITRDKNQCTLYSYNPLKSQLVRQFVFNCDLAWLQGDIDFFPRLLLHNPFIPFAIVSLPDCKWWMGPKTEHVSRVHWSVGIPSPQGKIVAFLSRSVEKLSVKVFTNPSPQLLFELKLNVTDFIDIIFAVADKYFIVLRKEEANAYYFIYDALSGSLITKRLCSPNNQMIFHPTAPYALSFDMPVHSLLLVHIFRDSQTPREIRLEPVTRTDEKKVTPDSDTVAEIYVSGLNLRRNGQEGSWLKMLVDSYSFTWVNEEWVILYMKDILQVYRVIGLDLYLKGYYLLGEIERIEHIHPCLLVSGKEQYKEINLLTLENVETIDLSSMKAYGAPHRLAVTGTPSEFSAWLKTCVQHNPLTIYNGNTIEILYQSEEYRDILLELIEEGNFPLRNPHGGSTLLSLAIEQSNYSIIKRVVDAAGQQIQREQNLYDCLFFLRLLPELCRYYPDVVREFLFGLTFFCTSSNTPFALPYCPEEYSAGEHFASKEMYKSAAPQYYWYRTVCQVEKPLDATRLSRSSNLFSSWKMRNYFSFILGEPEARSAQICVLPLPGLCSYTSLKQAETTHIATFRGRLREWAFPRHASVFVSMMLQTRVNLSKDPRIMYPIVNQKLQAFGWRVYFIFLTLELMYLVSFLLLLHLPLNDAYLRSVFGALTLAMSAIFLVFELRKLDFERWKWFTSFYNLLSLFAYSLVLGSCWLELSDKSNDKLSGIAILLLCVHAMLHLRIFQPFGVFFGVILQIFIRITPFIMTMLIIIAAFAETFFLLLRGEEPSPTRSIVTLDQAMQGDITGTITQTTDSATGEHHFATWLSALSAVYEFLMGQYDTMDPFDSIVLAVVLKYLFYLITTVVLLNMLIALLNNVYKESYKQAENSLLNDIARWLAEMEFYFLPPHLRLKDALFPELIFYNAYAEDIQKWQKEAPLSSVVQQTKDKGSLASTNNTTERLRSIEARIDRLETIQLSSDDRLKRIEELLDQMKDLLMDRKQ